MPTGSLKWNAELPTTGGHAADISSTSASMARAFRALLVVASLQFVLSTIFAVVVPRPVFDEVLYRADVERYRDNGVSGATLRAQQSASPPLMAVLAGLGGRLTPGDFRGYRLPIVASAFLMVLAALALARRSPNPEVAWTLSLLFCFPHVPISFASLMTEGPATAAILGALLCTVVGLAPGARALPFAVLAGVCSGLGILSRHYSLAMGMAVPLTWLVVTRRWLPAFLAAAGVVGALVFLFVIWGGLMSPSFIVPGGPERQTSVGLNLGRPLSALVFIGIYLAPLLAWGRVPRLVALAGGALLAAVLVAATGIQPLGNGPILSLVAGAARGHAVVQAGLTGLVVGVALLAVAAVIAATVARWRELKLLHDPVWIFSALATVFFVAQQLAVGGGSPYYERYSFLVFPWATYVGLRVLTPSWRVPFAVGSVLAVVGQLMLWRWYS